jgi:predicted RNA polymerase sigma factor
VRLCQVRQAFIELPDEQRAALHLVAIEGLTYTEAAVTLGIPVGTLMSRIARARAALRTIEDNDFESSTSTTEGRSVEAGMHRRVEAITELDFIEGVFGLRFKGSLLPSITFLAALR